MTFSRQYIEAIGGLKTVVASLSLILALRVVRAWNQTGQKHAGEADIARNFLPTHTCLLWALIFTTYIHVIQKIARSAVPWASRRLTTAASMLLGTAALGFKVAFLNADAPELLVDPMRGFLTLLDRVSLVMQARAVFVCIGLMAVMTVLPAARQNSSHRVSPGSAYRQA